MIRRLLLAAGVLTTIGLQASAETSAGILFFEERVARDPDDFIAWNQLANRRLQLLRTTGELEHLRKAERAAEASLKAVGARSNPGGLAVRARVQLGLHRFTPAAESARQLQELQPGKAPPLLLLGDALFELGEYEEAERTYSRLEEAGALAVEFEPRLAKVDWIRGRVAEAKERLAAAVTSAKEEQRSTPETVAWCHVQLGELCFVTGDWEAAEREYQRALSVLPDYWAALDHLAELRGAQERWDDALAIYTRLTEKVARPELLQAAGDLCQFAGRKEDAAKWHARAEAAYLKGAAEDAVLYAHHLAGFYSDSVPQPARAVEWARKDLAHRQSIHAFDALAWALYQRGEAAEAAKWSTKALATGCRDSHLLYHAGMIRIGSGDVAGGKTALQQAAATNPRFNTFHVHR